MIHIENFLKMTKEEMTDYLREVKFKESIGGSMCDASSYFVTNILKVRGVPKVYINHLKNSLSKKLYSFKKSLSL